MRERNTEPHGARPVDFTAAFRRAAAGVIRHGCGGDKCRRQTSEELRARQPYREWKRGFGAEGRETGSHQRGLGSHLQLQTLARRPASAPVAATSTRRPSGGAAPIHSLRPPPVCPHLRCCRPRCHRPACQASPSDADQPTARSQPASRASLASNVLPTSCARAVPESLQSSSPAGINSTLPREPSAASAQGEARGRLVRYMA